MIWSKEMTAANEQAVCKLLNKYCGKYRLAADKYSPFDINGRDDTNRPVIIEVKCRSKWYKNLHIEEDKLLSLFKTGRQNPDGNTVFLLVVSVNGEHKVYDCKDIWLFGRRENSRANKNTLNSTENKINKKMIAFEWDTEMFTIDNEGWNLGYQYEIIE